MSEASPYLSPLFQPLRRWLDALPPVPDSAAITALAERFPIRAGSGQKIRFVPPQADGLPYECRIWERGEVETRPDNWHDFFNALVWFAFPHAKVALSAAHRHATWGDDPARGQVRDALTHFDECGIVVLSSQPELLDLLRNFSWKALFVTHRAEVRQAMSFVVFGHATYESLLKPYRGLTAKAVLYDVDAAWLKQPPEIWQPALDRRLAADLASARYACPQAFQPLPLLGIPGVTPESEDPAYYDDTWQFRPGRMARHKAALLPC